MRFQLGRSLLIATTLSFGTFVFTGLGARTGESQRKASTKSSQPWTRAETLFRRNCSRCHGVDGRGQTTLGKLFEAPDFTDSDWWAWHSSTKELITIITHGKKHMPAFGKKLTKSQIASLANYVQTFNRS